MARLLAKGMVATPKLAIKIVKSLMQGWPDCFLWPRNSSATPNHLSEVANHYLDMIKQQLFNYFFLFLLSAFSSRYEPSILNERLYFTGSKSLNLKTVCFHLNRENNLKFMKFEFERTFMCRSKMIDSQKICVPISVDMFVHAKTAESTH